MSEAEFQSPLVPAGAAALAAALARVHARQMTAEELIGEAGRLAAHELPLAVALYKTWLALNAGHPGAPAIYFNYAVCLSDSGDLPGAINALRETIRLKPDFGPPHINLGGLLGQCQRDVQERMIWHFLMVHDDYGTRVGKAIGLTADDVKGLPLLPNQKLTADDQRRLTTLGKNGDTLEAKPYGKHTGSVDVRRATAEEVLAGNRTPSPLK